MIVDNATGREIQSTLQGEKIAMGIDPDPTVMAHIMDSLTNLYSDPEGACIREYSTNARDATIEAGSKKPIEVSTPGSLSPFLTIRDYGIGLSVEDIHTIYSQYGTSTKRGTNALNGTLGFGCKSALAYCDQFTVVSVKSGTKVTVVVSRNDDGGGSMTVLDTSATDDPEGTTVQIPAKSGNDMLAKAERFFSVWEKGTVLLNGRPPKRFDGLRLTDDLYIIEDEQSYVVMGGVTYPAEFDLPGAQTTYGYRAGRYSNYCSVNVMAFVPIGAVNFPPSREALRDTKNTKETIKKIETTFANEVGKAIQREVDACATPQDAVRTIIKWNKYVAGNTSVSTYTYRGTAIPQKFDAAGLQYSPLNAHRRGVAGRTPSIGIHDWPGTVWVTDFAPGKYTAVHKDKMKAWVAMKDLEGVTQFVMIPYGQPHPTSEFIDKARVVDWDTIRAIKLATRPTRSGMGTRIAGSFDVWTKKDGGAEFQRGLPGCSLDTKNPIYWRNGNKWECQRFADLLAKHGGKFTLVCLPANRIEKFKRDVPSAKPVREACDALYAKWLKKLTKDEKIALAMYDVSATSEFKVMDSSKVDDPALKTAIRCSKIDAAKFYKERREFQGIVAVGEARFKSWENPLTEKYPLYDESMLIRGSDDRKQHVYNYLNATFAGKL